jgi:hypothetical protein
MFRGAENFDFFQEVEYIFPVIDAFRRRPAVPGRRRGDTPERFRSARTPADGNDDS